MSTASRPCPATCVPTRSPAALEAQRLARLYAPARVPVVIVGATGTGKSHLARWIHAWSGRPDGLTDVTVGEFDPNLARDQLFGHIRGGFTGAVERRSGLLTEAEGGTLLLDDFHNLGLETQAMLLRVLDTGWYRPIGYDRNLPVRCRLLLGMREDPDSLLTAGRLLPDLRYRLGRAEIRLPRLEDRREDIVPLAERFLHRCREDTGVDGPHAFARDVPAVLEAASWPGNLRDLRSTVQIAYLNGGEASEGLVDSVRVYGSQDEALEAPQTAVQTTRNYYDRLGYLDSTFTPGGRKQHYLRYADGNPLWEFPGNGTYVTRSYDWQHRLKGQFLSYVEPWYSVDGQPFADAATKAYYQSLNLVVGTTLSAGVTHVYDYDNKGHLSRMEDSVATHTYQYSPTGALIRDTLTFADGGARVVRTYEYNPRGQRTKVTDAVSGVTLSGGNGAGSIQYVYNNTTARLDTMVGRVGGTTFARARWLYDRGGRDTLRAVRPADSSGVLGTELTTITRYDTRGRVSYAGTASSGTWYKFETNANSYNAADELLYQSGTQPGPSGGPGNTSPYSYTYTYESNGTRRLTQSVKGWNGISRYTDYGWSHDVFGNRTDEWPYLATGERSDCPHEVDSVGASNELLRTRCTAAPYRVSRYGNDRTGNRLYQLDSVPNQTPALKAILTYTATNQLFFSMSPTAADPASYDFNWHWYDGQGLRIMTHVQGGQAYIPQEPPEPESGTRSYYVYDGSDVHLALRRSDQTWRVEHRYLVGAVDQPLAGRFTDYSGNKKNLAFVLDQQGTTVAAMRHDGTQEDQTSFFSRNPFGRLEGASGTGTGLNVQTGFTGASTPNQTGGFTYLRNRWYDPNTGRFLTQDPVGLAGGVNLYAYAGSNPIAYADPFGLCPPRDDYRGDCPFGSLAGQEATDYWAAKAANATTTLGKAGATAMGLFASLWTPETATKTGLTLAAAGSASLALRAAGLAGGGGVAAETAVEPTAGQLRLVAQQLESGGRSAVEKSVRTWTQRLAEHEADLHRYRAAGGHTSSVEREIKNFRGLIQAAKNLLDQ